MKRAVDWGLYLVTDRQMAAPRTIEETVRAALPGAEAKALREIIEKVRREGNRP